MDSQDGENFKTVFPFCCGLPEELQEAPQVDLNMMIIAGNFKVEDAATLSAPLSPWRSGSRILIGSNILSAGPKSRGSRASGEQ